MSETTTLTHLPSAAMVPAGFRRNPTLWSHIGSRFGVKAGTMMHVRDHGDAFFVSTDLYDTILFPKDHDLAGQARYDWTEDPDREGLMLGTLTDVARAEMEAKP